MSYFLNYSPMESDRFSISAGKLSISDVADASKIITDMKAKKIEFCSTRIPTENLPLLNSLLQIGFVVTDTLVYYKTKLPSPHNFDLRTVRLATERDHTQIIDIAEACFKNYSGHYHSDPKLDPTRADEVYIDWAKKCCENGFQTDSLLITEDGSKITSFITLMKSGDTAKAMLGGVHPSYQGKGLYRNLIQATQHWGYELGCSEIEYSTQITNTSVQKVWAQLGGFLYKSEYTLHFWV